MKWSSQKSILFQVEIIKLCSENIIETPVQNVNKSSSNSGKTANSQKNIQTNSIPGKDTAKNNKDEEKTSMTQAISGYGEAKGWKNILNELRQNGKIMIYSNLLKAKAIELNDMTIGISFPDGINAFGKSILEKPESINELAKTVSMEYGKDMKVRIIENADSLTKKEVQVNPVEKMATELHIPINVIE